MEAQLTTWPHKPYPDGEIDHYLLPPGKETFSCLAYLELLDEGCVVFLLMFGWSRAGIAKNIFCFSQLSS